MTRAQGGTDPVHQGWRRSGLEDGVGFHQKPQSPPGTMVVTARMSGLKSFFSTNSLLLQLQVFIASVDP